MGKFNEIQEETKQSFGNNSFTTKIANDAVEFDSAADQFKFLDPIDAPSITINGEPVTTGGLTPDANGNYNLGGVNNTFASTSANNAVVGAPTAPEVANTLRGENSLVVGMKNTTGAESGSVITVGYNNTVNGVREIAAGEGNTLSGISNAAIASSSSTVSGQYSAAVGTSNSNVTAPNSVVIGGRNNTIAAENSVILGSTGRTLETQNTTMVTNFVKNGYEIMQSTTGVTTTYKYEKADLNQDATERSNWALYAGLSWYNKAIIKLAYCVTTASPSTITAQVKNFQGLNVSLTVDGQWHEIIIDNPYPKGGADFNVEDAVSGDIVNIIATVYVA